MTTIKKLLFLFALLASTTAVQAAQIKIATLAPEGSGWMQDMRAAAEEIKERTDGRVLVKLYGGGVMGSDKTVLRKMRSGQLQGATFTASGLAERYGDIQLYSMPMLFESLEEADYVRERMDEKLLEGLDEAGLVSFGFAQGGFAVLMSNKPVRSLADVKGQKVWVPEGDEPSYAAMVAMGVSPVALPLTDVLTGLQTGLIDIVATSPVGAVVLQWHTKVSYMTEIPLVYIFGTLVVEKKAFERLQPEDQEIFSEVMTTLYAGLDIENRFDNESAAQAMRDQGIVGVTPANEDVTQWREVVMDSNLALAEKGTISAELLGAIRNLSKEYRMSAGNETEVTSDASAAQDTLAGADGGR